MGPQKIEKPEQIKKINQKNSPVAVSGEKEASGGQERNLEAKKCYNAKLKNKC